MADDSSRGRPLLLGHRGARSVRSILENSFASFDRALADGCDGFEFDVRLTVDGEAVVCHDPKVGRVVIADSTRQHLANLPSLKDVLRRYQNSAFLDIELKTTGLEEITIDLLRAHSPQRGFVVSSFLPEILRTIRAGDSSIPLGLICERREELNAWKTLPIEHVIPHYRLLNARLMDNLKAAGKKVLVWTVNNRDRMHQLHDLGADGIISDHTALLCRTFSIVHEG